MQDNLVQILMFIGGLISGFIGFMFDVPPPTLWTAIFGCVCGVAIRPPVSMIFGAVLIVLVAAATGLLLPIIDPALPTNIPQKSISFVAAFIVIAGRNLLPDIAQETMSSIGVNLQKVINAAGDRAVTFITTFGKKEPNGSGDPKP